LRLDRFHAYVRTHVTSPPARVLEVGCGDGELARMLAADGYDVVAIDPSAPEGAMFRAVPLEEFDEPGRFDAIVASLSLHHVASLERAVEKLARLLHGHGVLVLQEWAKERFAGDTARWYHAQRLARAPEDDGVPADFDEWSSWSADRLADVHPLGEVLEALGRRFEARALEWVPYLYSHALDDDVEPEERALIASGAIAATGVLYAGGMRAA
jgi:SAM-dependent methyltransferase